MAAHAHSHAHATAPIRGAFAVAIALNVALAAGEIAFAAQARSLSLLADAGHNVGDVLGLALAWAASRLARRPATARHTYGYRSSSILAALANAVLLLVAVGGVAWEAILRIARPEPVAGLTVAVVGAIAAVVNVGSAWLLLSGNRADLNVRAATAHLAADAGVSFGVAVVGTVLCFLPWWWLDPVVSLGVAAVIVLGALRLLREALDLALAAVPRGIDLRSVERYLASVPGVSEVHDLHIWPTSTTETALTAHLVMPRGAATDALLVEVTGALQDRFRIEHATLQVEASGLRGCCPLPAGESAER